MKPTVGSPRHGVDVGRIAEFDEVIDARSPAEFADDHVPGAISCPVLFDEERARVGTLYVQNSPFEARKIGAVLVARNIARHIEEQFLDKPKHWRPLVYCWRGGQRSGAFTHILREIGWDAHRLTGGYKSWRREVMAALASRPAELRYVVLAGATGSAKSRILEAIAGLGGQVLHLEALAAHKGSVLGGLPDRPQPSQRAFETGLYAALERLDPARPVFVEAESRRIGSIQLPDALLVAMRAAPCVRIEADLAARVDFLCRDYDYFLADRSLLLASISRLQGLQSNDTLGRWQALAGDGMFRPLVSELLEKHYDPLYRRSQAQNYRADAAIRSVAADSLDEAAIRAIAAQLLEGAG